jgi:hypothetical protein
MNNNKLEESLNNTRVAKGPYKKPSMKSVLIEPRRFESKKEIGLSNSKAFLFK